MPKLPPMKKETPWVLYFICCQKKKGKQFISLCRKRNYNETVTHTEMQMTNIFNKIYTMYKPGYMTRKIIITKITGVNVIS